MLHCPACTSINTTNPIPPHASKQGQYSSSLQTFLIPLLRIIISSSSKCAWNAVPRTDVSSDWDLCATAERIDGWMDTDVIWRGGRI